MQKFILFFGCAIFINQLSAQTYISDSIKHEGIDRDYILYIPAIYDGSEAVPLLLNLHGYSSNNFEQYFYGDFKSIADTANFIMVLPNGLFDGFGFRRWNCFEADEAGVDDVQFLSNLIDTISAAYNIDVNRIYSTGMSNGGFMSYTLAGELSNRIAAVASVCGSIDKDRFPAMEPKHPTPVMEIHGTADFTVPYNGSSEFIEIDSLISYWVNINNCNTEPEFIEVENISITDGCTAEHYIYSGGGNNANVELFKIINGGHTWPGTAFTYIGVTNLDINASKEIWNFLSRYSLDALTGIENENTTTEHSFTIFPNPFHDNFFIENDFDEEVDKIIVYDIDGNEIMHQPAGFQNTIEINTEAWQNGIYIVKIIIDSRVTVQTIIKSSF